MSPKPTRCEVFPVALDDAGLWLVSGNRPWLTGVIEADTTEHAEVALLLWDRGIGTAAQAGVHSTSWRDGFDWRTDTYMVLLKPVAAVRELWPQALPVTPELAAAVGPPPGHASTEAPDARDIDVLHHGLGHIKYLITTPAGRRKARNATLARDLGPLWKRALEPFEETLAMMYEDEHVPAA